LPEDFPAWLCPVFA